MISVEINDAAITAALRGLFAVVDDMSPAMADIGEYLVKSTKERFPTGTGPDGAPWKANSPATLARKKETRPLFGETGLLSSQIFANSGPDGVEWGSNRKYAAMMQFGGKKSTYPHLWGDIPARPFLGISEDDHTAILDIVSEALATAFQQP